jgi:hypothetical protein
MPHSKTVVVGGVSYQYMLKFGSTRYLKETSKDARLILHLDQKYVVVRLESKLWTRDHEDDNGAPVHRNSLKPRDVASIIKALLHDQLPGLELPTWRVVCHSVK